MMAADHPSEFDEQISRIKRSMRDVRLYSFQLISEDEPTCVAIDKYQRALVMADDAFTDLKERWELKRASQCKRQL